MIYSFSVSKKTSGNYDIKMEDNSIDREDIYVDGATKESILQFIDLTVGELKHRLFTDIQEELKGAAA
jgi:hypothetical protein